MFFNENYISRHELKKLFFFHVINPLENKNIERKNS